MDKKSKIRTGLSFGIGMTVFFILQDLLTLDSLSANEIIKSIGAGLFAGAISGLLFGWLMGVFVKSDFVKQTTKITIDADETILFETGANHLKGIEGVGGKLYLTNKRLVFKSHKLNVQNHQLSLNLADIENVDAYKTLGVLNNGLLVTTIDKATEKFVVDQQGEWVKLLTDKNNILQQ